MLVWRFPVFAGTQRIIGVTPLTICICKHQSYHPRFPIYFFSYLIKCYLPNKPSSRCTAYVSTYINITQGERYTYLSSPNFFYIGTNNYLLSCFFKLMNSSLTLVLIFEMQSAFVKNIDLEWICPHIHLNSPS